MTKRDEGRRGGRVAEDTCPTCGTRMRPHVGALEEVVNGETISVPRISYHRCPKCGELLIDASTERQVRHAAFEMYRRRHRLLDIADIRELRRRLGMTQGELAGLLRLGPNTISRWEAGRNVQTAAMDLLLRLLRDVPNARAYLRRHAA
jgi:putative zinc finger/helix-turn-helix YgiT family protein